MKDHDFTNALPSGTLLHGKKYDYLIHKALGQGAFGITYLATVRMAGELGSIDANVKVAIKEFFMKSYNGRDCTSVTASSSDGLFEDSKRRFVRESQNLGKMQHPHIVKVLECFEANNTVYYSMEYLSGGSLDDYIQAKGRLGEYEATRFARQIAGALSYMHAQGMLHLDLKPGNVMMHSQDSIALIDFGLAKIFDTEGNLATQSTSGIGRGTPGYAPIEQANYQEGMGFPATMDIYALGATLFKMLTGQRPPEASDVLNDGLPDKPALVSSGVWAAVETAMQPMRKKRPQTVEEYIKLLPNIENVASDSEATIVDTGKPETTPVQNIHEGHEWVDLGLSVKWAACNIGAERPEDCGDYFAWGETSTKSEYTSEGSKTRGKNMDDIAGNSHHDTACANWGGQWRTPTSTELMELIDYCEWHWTALNGRNGFRVISKLNGNSIFLPAAGYRSGALHFNTKENGYYWSSTPHGSLTESSFHLYFNSSYHVVDWSLRYYGRSVRPVCE